MKYILVVDGMGFIATLDSEQLEHIQEVVKYLNKTKVNIEVFIYPIQYLKFNDALVVIEERRQDASRNNKFWQHNLYDR